MSYRQRAEKAARQLLGMAEDADNINSVCDEWDIALDLLGVPAWSKKYSRNGLWQHFQNVVQNAIHLDEAIEEHIKHCRHEIKKYAEMKEKP